VNVKVVWEPDNVIIRFLFLAQGEKLSLDFIDLL